MNRTSTENTAQWGSILTFPLINSSSAISLTCYVFRVVNIEAPLESSTDLMFEVHVMWLLSHVYLWNNI